MKKQRCHLGQSLLEFALLFPLVLLLITGLFDLGRAIFYYSSLTNAVREAARYAIVHKDLDDDEIKDKVLEFAFALKDTAYPLDPNKIDITYPTVENETNITISIKATYTFKPITPGITLILGSPGIDLVAQSTMRIAGAAR